MQQERLRNVAAKICTATCSANPVVANVNSSTHPRNPRGERGVFRVERTDVDGVEDECTILNRVRRNCVAAWKASIAAFFSAVLPVWVIGWRMFQPGFMFQRP